MAQALTEGQATIADTLVLLARVTVHEPMPEHPPPLQPENMHPVCGAVVSLTAVPPVKEAVQVGPQLIPAGVEVTVPSPVPVLLTVRLGAVELKVAATAVTAVMVTVQAPVPEQPPPLQPEKFDPLAGLAVKVTTVPLL